MATGFCGGISRNRNPYTIPRLSQNMNYPIRFTTPILVSLDQPDNSFPDTTDLLQLSNSLLFMGSKLGNHAKLSSQVRNLANMHSLFTDQIEAFNSAGVHVIELISHEYFRVIYQNKYSTNEVVESLLELSNNEVRNLQAHVNKTLESAYHLLAEQDKTSILFHEEISFLQHAQYHRGRWIFQNGDYKKINIEETLIFLDQNRENLKRSWTALENQRRQLFIFLEKIQRMKASS
ncbi:hypothetical protein MJO28_002029 [Puccinia striiformis f. sp. tritici]|nr:hypothetical protein MJO28_002029 [Puccinia striiformis f. sp. tritici]POW04873.1 hypothetical protein PSTT_10114 [Puccinia striiformis]